MPLWEDLSNVTAQPDGAFRNHTESEIMVLLHELHSHNHMRRLPDGRPATATLRRQFERSFREQFSLTDHQYDTITSIFDRCSIGDIPGSISDAVPLPPHGVCPRYTRKCFASDTQMCCGYTLRSRLVHATVYERDGCYPAFYAVKDCRGGCGARYMFDKRVLRGTRNGSECSWHVFKSWDDTKLPDFIASKSGHFIISSSLLRDTAINQTTSKAGFQTFAEIHNRTVRHEGGSRTVPLTGSVLLECWALFAALKHKQCKGPWWWNPPAGQSVLVDNPREVAIFDDRGNLSGANFWSGLEDLLDEVTEEIQQQALWTRHQCDACCQDIEVEGETFPVRAAVADGLTAVRFQKCNVHGCSEDVLRNGQRSCAYHYPMHGHRCAITDPDCGLPREEGRLTCSQHRSWEDRYNAWRRRGGLHVRSAARNAGEDREPAFMKYLRSCLGPRYTFGYLLVTATCGAIHGMSPIFESESSDLETAEALNDIYRASGQHPTILFYDRACFRRRFLLAHPDPAWASTVNYVDRFHARNHKQPDCLEFCSPFKTDDPLLYRTDANNRFLPRWNTSIAESTNAFIHGLGKTVSKMSRTLNRFVLITNMLVHNELLLSSKLMGRNPSFRT